MDVADMVTEVNQDFLESTGDFHSTAAVVRALNEAYTLLYAAIVQADDDGQIFAIEETFTYPADTRNVSWSSVLSWRMLRLHALEDVSGGATKPGVPIKMIRRRDEPAMTGRSSALFAMTQALRLFLTQNGGPPSDAQSLRVSYTPAPIELKSSGNVTDRDGNVVTWDVYEPEFIPGLYSSIIAYAVLRLTMSEERPSGEAAARFREIQASVVEYARQCFQNQDLTEIAVTQPDEYRMMDCY